MNVVSVRISFNGIEVNVVSVRISFNDIEVNVDVNVSDLNVDVTLMM